MQKAKSKKIWNIVVNVVVAVIVVVVFFISLTVLIGGKKGYVSFFGTASVAVKTDSMVGDKEDSFNPGDLIRFKVLSDAEKQELEIGDVITFYDFDIYLKTGVDNQLNTHRIVDIVYANDDSGFKVRFRTQGDHESEPDATLRDVADVVGLYTGKTPGLGKVSLFFQSSTGFLVCVVIPAILIVAYCIWWVVRSARAMRGKKKETDEKERLRREILREMGIDPDSPEGRVLAEKAALDAAASAPADSEAVPEGTEEERKEAEDQPRKDERD